MQKVHGPPIDPTFKPRRYLAQPLLGPLLVSVLLLLVLCALILFRSFGAL